MKKTIFAILLIAIFPLLITAQPLFSPKQYILDGQQNVAGVQTILPIDMDMDGDLDLLSHGGSRVAWHENEDGFGQFGRQRIIVNAASSIEDLDTVDWDSDGWIDILIAYGDNTIAWCKNLGSGSRFSAPEILTTELFGNGLHSIKAEDMDADGDLDILVAQAFDDQIYWHEREGLVIDSTRNIIFEGLELVSELYYFDFDGDQIKDIITYSSIGNDIHWLKNLNGAGNFGAAQLLTNLSGHSSPNFMDIDGDGDLDLFANSWNQNVWGWYENRGGFFSNLKIVDNSLPDVYTVFGGDVDGDGDIDAVANSRDRNTLYWYENEDGRGDFGNRKIIDHPLRFALPGFFLDIDHDNDQDLFVIARDDYKILLYENQDGAGDFATQQIINKGGRGFRSLLEKDINGDGKQDLLTADFGGRVSYFLKGNQARYSQLETLMPEHALELLLTDLNADTLQDLVGVSPYQQRFYELTNLDGKGEYAYEETTISTLDETSGVQLGDFDGDGDQDILAIDNNSVTWYRNDQGANQFSPAITIEGPGVNRTVGTVADLDQDGDLDFLATDGSLDQVLWYENEDGQGTFSMAKVVAGLDGATAAAAMDIDGDGDLDVIAGSFNQDRVVWYENEDGRGTFSAEKMIVEFEIDVLFIPTRYTFAQADLDNDGDEDLIINWLANPDNQITWFENLDGQGSFDTGRTLNEVSSGFVLDILPTDIDGDGDIDIVVSDVSDIHWYENLLGEAQIFGLCYFDENENQMRDSNEIGLNNFVFDIEPNALGSYTDRDGVFSFAVSNGTYTISPRDEPRWRLTTDSSSYNVTVQDSVVSGLEFGYQAIPYTEITTRVATGVNRCGFVIKAWLGVQNTGTTTENGYVALVLDSLIGIDSLYPMPDTIIGNRAVWNFTDVQPGQVLRHELFLQMPGVEFLGEKLSYLTSTYLLDSLSDAYLYEERLEERVVRCAYDPNDKLVDPPGVEEENYTLFGDTLEYTIRFQNTGTDTAFTVAIEDTLADHLDWNTLTPLSSSHPYELTFNQSTGLARFIFPNILLPDSTTNEPDSHGFITFRILTKEGLAENTRIENTAGIFFDFNPPIITNTTLNTFVSELPEVTQTKELATNNSFRVFPNPFQNEIVVQFDPGMRTEHMILELWDVSGRLIQAKATGGSQEVLISGERLPRGLYVFVLRDQGGLILGRRRMVK